MKKIIHHSVFKGIVSIGNNNGWETIALKSDKNDFKIDLIDRLKEVKMNFNNQYGRVFKINIFVSDEIQPYEKVDGNWSIVEESHYTNFEKNAYDVEYFEDWQENVKKTNFSIGKFDIYKFLESRVGKWIYVKFEIIEDKK
jgi:hypothetical protein